MRNLVTGCKDERRKTGAGPHLSRRKKAAKNSKNQRDNFCTTERERGGD